MCAAAAAATCAVCCKPNEEIVHLVEKEEEARQEKKQALWCCLMGCLCGVQQTWHEVMNTNERLFVHRHICDKCIFEKL